LYDLSHLNCNFSDLASPLLYSCSPLSSPHWWSFLPQFLDFIF